MVNRNKSIKKIVIAGTLVLALTATPVSAFMLGTNIAKGPIIQDIKTHAQLGVIIREPGEYRKVTYFTYPITTTGDVDISCKAGFKLIEAHLMDQKELATLEDGQIQDSKDSKMVVRCTYENFTKIMILDNGVIRYDEIPQETYQYKLSFDKIDSNNNLAYIETFVDSPYPQEIFPVPTSH